MSLAFIQIDNIETAKRTIIKISAIFLLLIWAARLFSNLGLSQLSQPVFLEMKADRVFWFLQSVGLLGIFTKFLPLAIGIDIILLISPILIFLYPEKKTYSYINLLALCIYFISFNAAVTHHEHRLVAAIFISFLICFKKSEQFSTVFLATRFYACFLMASAAFWKIGRGSLFSPDQMQNILKNQHSQLLSDTNISFYNNFIQNIIDNSFLSRGLLYFGTILELLFIIGFFTRKADYLLLAALWLFIIADFFIMDIHFWELGILGIVFWKGFGKFFN